MIPTAQRPDRSCRRKELSTAHDPACSAAHAAPGIGALLTPPDPAAGYVTIISIHTVARERAKELLDSPHAFDGRCHANAPGFAPTDFHVNLDRTQEVNYARQQEREVVLTARDNPEVASLTGAGSKIADDVKLIRHELRQSAAAAVGDAEA